MHSRFAAYSCPSCGLHVLIPHGTEPGQCECPSRPGFVRDEPPDSVGGRIRWQRERRRKTLREVATAAGISYAYLCEVENDKKRLGLDRAHRICTVLGVSLDWLVGGAS